MPFLTGGDLRFHLQTMGQLHEQWVLWYACEMILALAALANNYVVHRDVKPGTYVHQGGKQGANVEWHAL